MAHEFLLNFESTHLFKQIDEELVFIGIHSRKQELSKAEDKQIEESSQLIKLPSNVPLFIYLFYFK